MALTMRRARRSCAPRLRFLPLYLFAVLALPCLAIAQTPTGGHPTVQKYFGKSDYQIANDEVSNSRGGGRQATVDLAHEMFRSAGISPTLADSLGFTTRAVDAQTAYWKGNQSAFEEHDVVSAVNGFADELGLPSWAHTDQTQIRKLRVTLLLDIPQLFVNTAPPDSHHRHQLLNDKMSPMEAGYLATAMLFRKTHSIDYQFSDAERAQYMSKGKLALADEHLQREKFVQDILRGRSESTSVADLLPAVDHMFKSLGMPQTSGASSANVPDAGSSPLKGGL
jgi:hypothetical protein